MKEKIVVAIFAIVLAFSGLVGFSTAVNAGNTTDTSFQFYNTNDIGYTEGRNKENSTKVYIHPTSGPALQYTVQGNNSVGWQNRSSSHIIYNGDKASFTNYVYENGETQARLCMERTQTAYQYTYGVWSPDSTKNYTVYY
jgi:anaerobic selenocysteine-containing dehydrogenase